VANLKQSGRIEALYQMMLASKAPSEERLARVSVPALVVMGSKDPDFKDPEAEARLIAGKMKAQVHILPGAGHYPHVEMIDAVLPLVLPFLAGVTHAAHDA
jgi:pimeloyl-ACP methyl ester carboxylesterase